MADEGNESITARMDLNLYLGIPRSPLRSSLADLGSDLALGSLPLPSSPTEESPVPADDMSGATAEPVESRAPNSPSHASYNPELSRVDTHRIGDALDTIYGPYRPPSPPADEPEGQDARYSPANARPLPAIQESNEPPPLRYDPVFPQPPGDPAPPLAEDDDPSYSPTNPPFPPPSPPYSPTSPAYPSSSPTLGDLEFSLYSAGDFLPPVEGSLSQDDLLRYPEYRFRRLFEVNHRLRHRRFRSNLPYSGERPNTGRSSSPAAVQLAHATASSQREREEKDEEAGERTRVDGTDDEAEDKARSAANFECNICLDMAKEPVVTSCGHLFCWACLYQWLNLHCDHKECPVCKGEVVESNITPIYGRGSSESSNGKKLEQVEESGLNIPPRPRGNRFESFRQQYRPNSRRLGDGIASGIAASWQRMVDRHIHFRNMVGAGHGEPPLLGTFDGYHPPVTRMRARRMQMEEAIPETGLNNGDAGEIGSSGAAAPRSGGSNLLFREGIDILHQLSLHGLSFGRVVNRFSTGSNRSGASTSSPNAPVPEPTSGRPPAPSADQASASSTMAVIQGDAAAVEPSVEPNSAGSSRSYRRRGRSITPGSLDVDGGALNERKRRRF